MSVSKASVAPPEGEVATSERKTVTRWEVFEKASLVPQRITCNGYLNSHPAELSCHSNILLTSDSVIHHLKPEHGGGWFAFKLRVTDNPKQKSGIWKELGEAGVEIIDLYCPHCRERVQMTPRGIQFHLTPHRGATRVNTFPATLCMTLGYGEPDQSEPDWENYEGN